jgi:hypothetical protein
VVIGDVCQHSNPVAMCQLQSHHHIIMHTQCHVSCQSSSSSSSIVVVVVVAVVGWAMTGHRLQRGCINTLDMHS